MRIPIGTYRKSGERVTLQIYKAMRITDKAVLCQFDDRSEIWIPFSQIDPVAALARAV